VKARGTVTCRYRKSDPNTSCGAARWRTGHRTPDAPGGSGRSQGRPLAIPASGGIGGNRDHAARKAGRRAGRVRKRGGLVRLSPRTRSSVSKSNRASARGVGGWTRRSIGRSPAPISIAVIGGLAPSLVRTRLVGEAYLHVRRVRDRLAGEDPAIGEFAFVEHLVVAQMDLAGLERAHARSTGAAAA